MLLREKAKKNFKREDKIYSCEKDGNIKALNFIAPFIDIIYV